MPVTTRAAAFNTRCNLSVVTFGEFARRALQQSMCDATNALTSVATDSTTGERRVCQADITNRNMKRWQWRRVDPGWGQTSASLPANGCGRKQLWYPNQVVILTDNGLAERDCVWIWATAIPSYLCQLLWNGNTVSLRSIKCIHYTFLYYYYYYYYENAIMFTNFLNTFKDQNVNWSIRLV